VAKLPVTRAESGPTAGPVRFRSPEPPLTSLPVRNQHEYVPRPRCFTLCGQVTNVAPDEMEVTVMSAVVLVDDDGDYREVTSAGLAARGHLVVDVADAETALFELTQHAVDAVVVDVSLPGMDGVTFIREVRRRGDTPLIALTVEPDVAREVEAFDAGADAFVTKAITIKELDARIRSLMCRGSRRQHEIVAGRMTIRPGAGHVQVGDRVIDLEPVDMRLLVVLASSPLLVHSRAQLRERVFGTDASVATNALEGHIRSLRAALEPDPQRPRQIVAVRGSGYRFVP